MGNFSKSQNAKTNAAGEWTNKPSQQQVSDFNKKFTTTYPQRSSKVLKDQLRNLKTPTMANRGTFPVGSLAGRDPAGARTVMKYETAKLKGIPKRFGKTFGRSF